MAEVRVGRGGHAVEAGFPALRMALALACATRRALVWEGFRRRSGGFEEHEAEVVRFFRETTGSAVEGGEPGDSHLRFEPGSFGAGPFALALSGREPLLPFLGAVAVPLAHHRLDAEVSFQGSTHAPRGASFEVATSSWRYWMKQVGLDLDLELLRAGFAPRGGGEVRLRVGGSRSAFAPLALGGHRELEAIRIVSAAARLPAHVQQRQAARARSGIQIAGIEPSVQLLKLASENPGSVVAITGVFDGVPVTVSAIPASGRSVESAGEEAASEFRQLVVSRTLVPPVLVEPLLLAVAFADGASTLSTWRLPPDVLPQAELVRAFTGRRIAIEGKPSKPARLHLD